MSAVAPAAPARTPGGVATWLQRHRDVAPSLAGAGLPWLADLRTRAIARFADSGWPSNRLENWRHTSLLFMEREDFAPGRAVTSAGAAGLGGFVKRLRAGEEGHWLIFVDGRFAPALSEVGALPAGAEVGSLAPALE
ncbi:MAG TPA: hypothetical protein VM468_06155, partial [Mycoplana sp.]|nr:hypothetical protein [Mycoplana sp.]